MGDDKRQKDTIFGGRKEKRQIGRGLAWKKPTGVDKVLKTARGEKKEGGQRRGITIRTPAQ